MSPDEAKDILIKQLMDDLEIAMDALDKIDCIECGDCAFTAREACEKIRTINYEKF